MRPRVYLLPRFGCLGWLVFGWLVLTAYIVIWGSVIAFALALYGVAALGVTIDWALIKTVGSYRARRSTLPLQWPAELVGAGSAALAALGGRR